MNGMKKYLFLLVLAALAVATGATEARAQGRRTVVVVRPYFASPLGFYGYYDPWFGDGQFGYPYPYPYRGYRVDPGASVRIEVKPKEAEVYVDGYYAGIVDDFNGVFQRLRVPPGEHDITLYLDGFRTVHQKVFLTPDNTFKLKYNMERPGPNEPLEGRPQPMPQAQNAPQQGGQPPAYPNQPPPQARGPYGRRPPQQPPQSQPPPPTPPEARGNAPQSAAAYGTLSVRVQPVDADVIVDGEKWRGPAGQERLAVDVPEGRHTVEIQKSGYRTYVTEVDIRRGETTPLNVSLRAQDQQ